MFNTVEFNCKDGYKLNGRFYSKQISSNHLPIVLAPATGIRQTFYEAFSTWLSEQGYDVLTFDFRGIGDSLYTDVSKSLASIQDWGIFDLPAAIEWLLERTQSEQVTLLGHSVGGSILGLAYNYAKVNKVVGIAISSGYLGGLKGKTKLLAPIMFHAIFPTSSLFKGYAATKALGMGENLPKKVGQQWRQFCSSPGYVMNAIGKTTDINYHNEITCSISCVHASDDEIATVDNVQDLLRIFPNAQTRYLTLDPLDYGQKNVGHMLIFKASHQNMWSIIKNELRP